MQKVIELSQSVVVDKSVIERFEEVQRQNYMSSSCSASENRASGDAAAAAGASATSIMMAAASAATTTTTTEATAETGGGTTTRTTTTKSISMSTFETRRTLSSGSGSPSSSNASSCSSGSLNGNVPRPGSLLGTEKQSLEMLLLQHKQQLAEQAAATAEAAQQEEQVQAEPGAEAVEEATTETEAATEEHNQSDDNSRCNKPCNIVKQQITLSLDLSDSNEEQQGQRSQAASSTPQTPITPTTPSAAAAAAGAAAAHGSSSNIPQKPIKVQSDKDCTVPYNIINNYFSVGVVSTQTHTFPPPCPSLGYIIIVPVPVVECKSVERFVSPAWAMQLPQGTCCRPHATRHTLLSSPISGSGSQSQLNRNRNHRLCLPKARNARLKSNKD